MNNRVSPSFSIQPNLRIAQIIPALTNLASLFLLAGCVVGPDYVPPTVATVPTQWHTLLKQPSTTVGDLTRWWTTFNDPQLSQLITQALANNLDLKKAAARIHEARAQYGIAEASYFPFINSSGGVGENYNGVSDQRNGRYSLGLDATWEIDLFGRISRSVESAQASIEVTEANYQAVQVSLLGDVALNYVQMRTLQTRLQVATDNLQSQTQIYQFGKWRWQAGLASKLEAEQALASVQQLQAQLPALKNQIAQNQHQLAILLGVTPASLNTQLNNAHPIPTARLAIAVGVPAEVLRQRPDIQQAERELAAQTAQIGVATAALYPKLALSGSIGLEAIKASNFFTAAGLVDSLLGRLTFPIFNAGAIRQNIQVQTAKQEQALVQYEATVLTALKEVENALIGVAEEQRRWQELNRAVQTAQRAVILAKNQYQSGLTDFQNVLQTQRTLLNLQDQRASSAGQVSSYFIALYKALGGGWQPVT